ncbi:MAG: short-chain dehydrogenase, partial [Polyangiales bacterium]
MAGRSERAARSDGAGLSEPAGREARGPWAPGALARADTEPGASEGGLGGGTLPDADGGELTSGLVAADGGELRLVL